MSKPSAPLLPWLLPPMQLLPPPTERQLRIHQSLHQTKTRETPTCETSVMLLMVVCAGVRLYRGPVVLQRCSLSCWRFHIAELISDRVHQVADKEKPFISSLVS